MNTFLSMLGRTVSVILYAVGGTAMAIWAAGAIIALVLVLACAVIAVLPLVLAFVVRSWADGVSTSDALRKARFIARSKMRAANEG
jgi:hypothetical protein